MPRRKGESTAPSYVVRKVELFHESEGPDYFTSGEFQVLEEATGDVVARFPWSLEEAYMAPASYSGPDRVVISDDGDEAVAIVSPREERRVLLPHATGPIVFDGIEIRSTTDIGALTRRVAVEDGPPNEKGWREPAGQWLWKLYERLGQSAMGRALVSHVAALLDDPDPRLRTAALRFYYFVPLAPGADRVLDIAEARPDAFADVRDTFIDALKMRRHHDSGSLRAATLAAREGIAE